MADDDNQNKAWNIDWIQQWAKAFQVIGALLLVVLAISRFFGAALASPPAFILTIYYFVFAGILLAAEFQFKLVMDQFYFLYYSWGKAVLDFFLFTMWFDTEVNPFFQIPVAIFFFVLGCMYMIVVCACRKFTQNEKGGDEREENAKEDNKV